MSMDKSSVTLTLGPYVVTIVEGSSADELVQLVDNAMGVARRLEHRERIRQRVLGEEDESTSPSTAPPAEDRTP